ncbi:MAG: glycosyltransferase family 4 protein [Candidatus Solibacter sp.]|jgi:glycosyltransferase involved in cell wall biosynthesis
MKVVTVHRGARDNYQVARGLSEAGMLEALVTDMYWPGDRGWAAAIERLAPRKVSGALRSRSESSLPSRLVTSCWRSGLYSLGLSKARRVSFEKMRDAVRNCDRELGRRAGELATERGAALLSYSYYGHSAFTSYSGGLPRMLFQLHPHPGGVREILLAERELHPECAASLDKEWELALSTEDFNHLVRESAMPEHWLVASSFSKQTLVDAGSPAARIHVIPYGTDLSRFTPRKTGPVAGRPLQLLFVGTLGQRKGITYLLEAVNMLPAGSVELTVCGRAVDGLELFRQSRMPIRLRPSVSAQELLAAYQSADVFVFPSLAEGFGHVLLEAMACGLPIVSTTRTAAPDLIDHGKEGFVTDPGNSVQVATCIEYFLQHPERIVTMGEAARRRAAHFTWDRFRRNVTEAVSGILEPSMSAGAHQYV